MHKRIDLIRLVETAYNLDEDREHWLGRILQECRPAFDRGLGIAGFTFEIKGGRLFIDSPVEVGTRPGFMNAYIAISEQTPPDAIEKAYLGAPGLETYRSVFSDSPFALKMFDEQIGPALGVTDFVALNALDPTGRGVAIVAPMDEDSSPAQCGQERWRRVGTHIAAGLRLRRLETKSGDLPLGGEAVLEPDGRLVEASGDATTPGARTALREAAQDADRARGRLRHEDGDAALEIWKGLVDGRWSLVDFFDSDGRRFLVAKRNGPDAPDPRSLTARERQVAHYVALGHSSKLIAYDLGIAQSTVATHLQHALRKLGFKTKAELTYFIRRLGADASDN